jgi:hypothetical protein
MADAHVISIVDDDSVRIATETALKEHGERRKGR